MYVSNWGEEDDGADLGIDVDEPVPVARTPASRGVFTFGLAESDDEDEEGEDAIPTQQMTDTGIRFPLGAVGHEEDEDSDMPVSNPPNDRIGPVRMSMATNFGLIDDESEEDDPEEETPFQRKADQVREPGPWACSLWQGLAC